MKLQKLDAGIYGIDLTVTAHTEKDDTEMLVEPDIGGHLDGDHQRPARGWRNSEATPRIAVA